MQVSCGNTHSFLHSFELSMIKNNPSDSPPAAIWITYVAVARVQAAFEKQEPQGKDGEVKPQPQAQDLNLKRNKSSVDLSIYYQKKDLGGNGQDALDPFSPLQNGSQAIKSFGQRQSFDGYSSTTTKSNLQDDIERGVHE